MAKNNHSLATPVPPTFVDDCKFVEVLTCNDSGDFLGYALGGSRPGPNLVLAGSAAVIDDLLARYTELPTLPWMWGRLYLVAIETAENNTKRLVRESLPDVPIDELIVLQDAAPKTRHSEIVENGYWAGLRLCSQMGMIAGRGVRLDTPI